MTCSYTCREYTIEKKTTMCKNDDLSSHQSSIKVPVLIESKGVGLSLEILKALKGLLQIVHLMLELLYHKRNPLTTTAVYGSIF